MNQLRSLINKIPVGIRYGILAIVIVLSYFPARESLIVQAPPVWAIKSKVTLNIILFIFLWGIVADRLTKKIPKWKGWLIWGIGLIGIIVFL